MKFAKITLVAALLAGATLANASEPVPYWERHDYGQYSAYSGSRVGGWSLSGTTTNQFVYYGETQACSPQALKCTQSKTQTIAFTWSLATGVTYQQTIVPLVNQLSITETFTVGKTFTDTDTFSSDFAPGYTSQYSRYVPRKTGNATVYGVRVATGATREDCTHQGLLHCYKHEKSWQYYNDPSRTASVMYGKKNTSDPIHYFIVRKT